MRAMLADFASKLDNRLDILQDAILVGYRDLAADRVFASSGDLETDMAVLDRKEADGWQ